VRYGYLLVAGSHQNLSGFPYTAVVKATTASSRLRTGNSIFSLSVSPLHNRPASHRYGTACTWEPSSLAPTTSAARRIQAGDDQSCLHRRVVRFHRHSLAPNHGLQLEMIQGLSHGLLEGKIPGDRNSHHSAPLLSLRPIIDTSYAHRTVVV